MKRTIVIFLIMLIYSNICIAKAVNSLCQKAHIESFFVDKLIAGTDRENLCSIKASETPIEARVFLKQVETANNRIIKSLSLDSNMPFLNELSLELKVSKLSIIDSAYEIKNNIPTIRLGTTRGEYFKNFSKFVYIHEVGHWYLSRYLPQTESIVGLGNLPTFQEFFADALVINIYGSLDTSDIKIPYCLRQIRDIGANITFKKSIGNYDYSSYFRNSNKCCSSLQSTGRETHLTKAICRGNKEAEVFYFPSGLPTMTKAPLHYNVNSLYLNTTVNTKSNRLEPHRTSSPINSFLFEFANTTNRSMLEIILPALKSVAKNEIIYKCAYKDLLKQSVYDLSERISISTLDYFIPEIRKQLKIKDDVVLFDKLFKKYSMRTAQVIVRNELIDIAKFSVQGKLKKQLYSAWKNDKYFLKKWHCLDQITGEQSKSCRFDVVCNPEDQDKKLKREFLRRDQNKSIYTPVVRFVNQLTAKEVLFVGLNHTGPKHYFEKVERYLKKELLSPENTILREFYTCKEHGETLSSSVMDITDEQADFLNVFLKKTYYPYVFFKLPDSDLSPLFNTYQLTKDNCAIDVDGKSLRPRFIVERNERACKKANSNSMDCQWDTVEKMLSHSPMVKEGDLVLSEESSAVQISSLNMYQGLPSGGNLELWARLLIPTMYVLDDHRELNLIKNTLKELNSAKKRVILPWGVAHVQALKQFLYNRGFMQREIIEIPFAHMSDYGLDIGIDSMLTQDFEYIGTSYNF